MGKSRSLNSLPLTRWLFNWLSIRSKLQTIILLSSLLIILVTGTISYLTARNALQKSVYDSLTAFRAIQVENLNDYFRQVSNEINIYSESNIVRESFMQLKSAYQELDKLTLSSTQETQLKDFYEREIIPKFKELSGSEPVVESYLPQSNAGKYVQYYYLANNPYDVGQKNKLNAASDGSRYSQIHEMMQPLFRRFAETFDYDDLLLVDPDSGEVIYTEAKQIDLGTNLKTGLYGSTTLNQVYLEVIKSRDPIFVTGMDYENYRPSFDKPSGFIGTTVYDNKNDKFIGALIFQISSDRLNNILTFNQKWRDVGLNNTGETLLIGEDLTLRTEPRLYLENPDQYFEGLRKIGYTEEEINRMWRIGTPILLQSKSQTEWAKKAFEGKIETKLTKDHRGVPVLASYQQIPVGSGNSAFKWALVAKIDQAEAFAPINRLGYLLFATSAVLLPLMVILANWLSNLFIAPIKRLLNASHRMAMGEKDVHVNIDSEDEFGQLGKAFNVMSHNLNEKEQSLRHQIQENKKLLLNLLPPDAVDKFLGGEREFADHYQNVSIVYGEVEGFSELVGDVDPEESAKLLNQLIGAFDELTELYGIEKIKTVGTVYVGGCGLSIGRVDSAKRTVDFAVAMISAIQTYNTYHNCCLTLDIGVHSGAVIGGIVGKSKFIYEVWGDTIKIAHGIHSSPKNNVVQVSEPVFRELNQIYKFNPLPKIVVKGIGDIAVWELDLASTQVSNISISK